VHINFAIANTKMKTGIYRHYKGSNYKVLGVATHSETLEKLVVYQKLYDDFSTWVRPYEMFNSNVELNGTTVKRFEFISDE
jgi:hypothetical protein